ncbi:MAG TPA: glycerophosphodiester phosphodiesterase family protein [Polyangiaceae bacterium]|nr:glycerophosphodiester phosphodiesterase family protein [Polyangiaceae bacterium]
MRVVFLGIFCIACSSGSDETPQPEPLLDPASYDCRAGGNVEPPARPHALDCYRDAGCSSPLVCGHRMATPFAPENSLSALRAAILLGVDVVETDVRLSADGEVVLLHDDTVDRTLAGSGSVESLTLAEIRAMPMRVDAALPGDFGCERVPTLDEIFAIADGRIVVELEVKDTDAGVRTAEYLRDHDVEAFLLCDRAECDALRAVVPTAPIMSRPETPAEVAGELAYEPPPILVHIDPTDAFLAEVDAIHARGAKAYANAFLTADVEALGDGAIDGYRAMFEAGLDVVQTELPHYALMALGRLPDDAKP